jgi:hypothetical protein
MKKIKSVKPFTSVYLHITDLYITDYCSDNNNLQKLSNSFSCVSIQRAARLIVVCRTRSKIPCVL